MSKGKILMVDDEVDVLNVFQEILVNAGFEVTAVLSGKEGLKSARENPPDCILTDFIMPEMNGPEFCKEVKSDEKLRSIPLVVLTAIDDKTHTLESIEAGADDFIGKVLDSDILVAKINAMLRVKFLKDRVDQLRLEAVKSMIATYNHQINNPLCVVFGKLKKIEGGIPEESKGDFKKAMDNLDRIREVIREISEIDDVIEEVYSGKHTMIKIGSTKKSA